MCSSIAARRRRAASGASRSSAQTSRLNNVMTRTGEVATTEAVRRPGRQDSDLADHVARSDHTDLCPIDRDVGRTGLHQEERMAELPLGSQHLTDRELAHGRHTCDGVELFLGEPSEEGQGCDAALIHERTLQRHRWAVLVIS